MNTRFTRRALVTTILASALALSVAIPAQASTTAANTEPTYLGIATFTSVGNADQTTNGLLLQDTNEQYPFHNEAHNVVVSPNVLLQHTRWQVWQVGTQEFYGYERPVYKFVNVATGRALQSTNESTAGANGSTRNIVTTPAGWNNAQQTWTANEVGGEVELYNVENSSVRLTVSNLPYLGNTNVKQVNGGDQYGFWAVNGVTLRGLSQQ